MSQKFLLYIIIFSQLLMLLNCSCQGRKSNPAANSDTLVFKRKMDSISSETPPTVIKKIAFKNDISGLPEKLTVFIPQGYTTIDTVSGDLNRDEFSDMILVLKKDGEDTMDWPPSRKLLLLTGNRSGRFDLAGKSDSLVQCISCGGMMGDPYMETVIKHGFFSVEHYGGAGERWEVTTTFRYSPADKNWFLKRRE